MFDFVYRLEWTPPPPHLINGINQGYVIELEEGIYTKTIPVIFDDSNPNGKQVLFYFKL